MSTEPSLCLGKMAFVTDWPAMRAALDTIARPATNDEAITYERFPWAELRFQHTAVVRAELAQRYYRRC
jgi:hypothetical protein